MQLSRECVYAIHALVHLTRHGSDRPLASHEIAKACGVPPRFLLKALKPLARVGVLRSLRGPEGGYQLGRPPQQITLLDIAEAIQGPMLPPSAWVGSKGSGERVRRALARAEERASEQTRKAFRNVTLRDLGRTGR